MDKLSDSGYHFLQKSGWMTWGKLLVWKLPQTQGLTPVRRLISYLPKAGFRIRILLVINVMGICDLCCTVQSLRGSIFSLFSVVVDPLIFLSDLDPQICTVILNKGSESRRPINNCSGSGSYQGIFLWPLKKICSQIRNVRYHKILNFFSLISLRQLRYRYHRLNLFLWDHASSRTIFLNSFFLSRSSASTEYSEHI